MTKTPITVALLLFCFAHHIRADGEILPPMITVASTGEVKVPPTEVVVNIAIEQRNKSVQGLRQQIDSVASDLIDYLTFQEVNSIDIQTTQITITPMYTQLSTDAGSTTIDYYFGQKSMTFVIKELSTYDEVMSGLYDRGLNRVDGIAYRVTDDWDLRLEAKRKAIANAKEVATTILTELGASVGNVYSISDYSYSDPVFIPGVMRAEGSGGDASISSSGPSVAGGLVTFSSNVNVVFYIIQ